MDLTRLFEQPSEALYSFLAKLPKDPEPDTRVHLDQRSLEMLGRRLEDAAEELVRMRFDAEGNPVFQNEWLVNLDRLLFLISFLGSENVRIEGFSPWTNRLMERVLRVFVRLTELEKHHRVVFYRNGRIVDKTLGILERTARLHDGDFKSMVVRVVFADVFRVVVDDRVDHVTRKSCVVVFNELIDQCSLGMLRTTIARSFKSPDPFLDVFSSLSSSILDCGDYSFQVSLVELLLRLLPSSDRTKELLADRFWPQPARPPFVSIDYGRFEQDARSFLVALNEATPTRRVISVVCSACHLGRDRPLQPPRDDEGEPLPFWVDFNLGSQSVSFYHATPGGEGLWSVFCARNEDVADWKCSFVTTFVLKIRLKKGTSVEGFDDLVFLEFDVDVSSFVEEALGPAGGRVLDSMINRSLQSPATAEAPLTPETHTTPLNRLRATHVSDWSQNRSRCKAIQMLSSDEAGTPSPKPSLESNGRSKVSLSTKTIVIDPRSPNRRSISTPKGHKCELDVDRGSGRSSGRRKRHRLEENLKRGVGIPPKAVHNDLSVVSKDDLGGNPSAQSPERGPSQKVRDELTIAYEKKDGSKRQSQNRSSEGLNSRDNSVENCEKLKSGRNNDKRNSSEETTPEVRNKESADLESAKPECVNRGRLALEMSKSRVGKRNLRKNSSSNSATEKGQDEVNLELDINDQVAASPENSKHNCPVREMAELRASDRNKKTNSLKNVPEIRKEANFDSDFTDQVADSQECAKRSRPIQAIKHYKCKKKESLVNIVLETENEDLANFETDKQNQLDTASKSIRRSSRLNMTIVSKDDSVGNLSTQSLEREQSLKVSDELMIEYAKKKDGSKRQTQNSVSDELNLRDNLVESCKKLKRGRKSRSIKGNDKRDSTGETAPEVGNKKNADLESANSECVNRGCLALKRSKLPVGKLNLRKNSLSNSATEEGQDEANLELDINDQVAASPENPKQNCPVLKMAELRASDRNKKNNSSKYAPEIGKEAKLDSDLTDQVADFHECAKRSRPIQAIKHHKCKKKESLVKIVPETENEDLANFETDEQNQLDTASKIIKRSIHLNLTSPTDDYCKTKKSPLVIVAETQKEAGATLKSAKLTPRNSLTSFSVTKSNYKEGESLEIVPETQNEETVGRDSEVEPNLEKLQDKSTAAPDDDSSQPIEGSPQKRVSRPGRVSKKRKDKLTNRLRQIKESIKKFTKKNGDVTETATRNMAKEKRLSKSDLAEKIQILRDKNVELSAAIQDFNSQPRVESPNKSAETAGNESEKTEDGDKSMENINQETTMAYVDSVPDQNSKLMQNQIENKSTNGPCLSTNDDEQAGASHIVDNNTVSREQLYEHQPCDKQLYDKQPVQQKEAVPNAFSSENVTRVEEVINIKEVAASVNTKLINKEVIQVSSAADNLNDKLVNSNQFAEHNSPKENCPVENNNDNENLKDDEYIPRQSIPQNVLTTCNDNDQNKLQNEVSIVSENIQDVIARDEIIENQILPQNVSTVSDNNTLDKLHQVSTDGDKLIQDKISRDEVIENQIISENDMDNEDEKDFYSNIKKKSHCIIGRYQDVILKPKKKERKKIKISTVGDNIAGNFSLTSTSFFPASRNQNDTEKEKRKLYSADSDFMSQCSQSSLSVNNLSSSYPETIFVKEKENSIKVVPAGVSKVLNRQYDINSNCLGTLPSNQNEKKFFKSRVSRMENHPLKRCKPVIISNAEKKALHKKPLNADYSIFDDFNEAENSFQLQKQMTLNRSSKKRDKNTLDTCNDVNWAPVKRKKTSSTGAGNEVGGHVQKEPEAGKTQEELRKTQEESDKIRGKKVEYNQNKKRLEDHQETNQTQGQQFETKEGEEKYRNDEYEKCERREEKDEIVGLRRSLRLCVRKVNYAESPILELDPSYQKTPDLALPLQRSPEVEQRFVQFESDLDIREIRISDSSTGSSLDLTILDAAVPKILDLISREEETVYASIVGFDSEVASLKELMEERETLVRLRAFLESGDGVKAKKILKRRSVQLYSGVD